MMSSFIIPERPLSRGELYNKRKLKKIKKTNKFNHYQQKRSKARKQVKFKDRRLFKDYGYSSVLDKLSNLT